MAKYVGVFVVLFCVSYALLLGLTDLGALEVLRDANAMMVVMQSKVVLAMCVGLVFISSGGLMSLLKNDMKYIVNGSMIGCVCMLGIMLWDFVSKTILQNI
ncbi:hypothetical protein ACTFR8_23230 [Bacillus cereus group sp. MYBK15-3]|uniref:hypothetical protein n=1 Tax=unclassified Bacillus cereus group TaxID=2750818 RepID=UPI003F7AAA0C